MIPEIYCLIMWLVYIYGLYIKTDIYFDILKNQFSYLGKYVPIIFFIFCLFRATPMAYGCSQARSQVGAVAASLCQNHSNARSKPCLLHHSSWKCWILNPLNEARDQTFNLMASSWIHFLWARMRTPVLISNTCARATYLFVKKGRWHNIVN